MKEASILGWSIYRVRKLRLLVIQHPIARIPTYVSCSNEPGLLAAGAENQEFNASTTILSKFRIHHRHFVVANPVVITALLWVFVAANSSRY
jgi:hypothetical protein